MRKNRRGLLCAGIYRQIARRLCPHAPFPRFARVEQGCDQLKQNHAYTRQNEQDPPENYRGSVSFWLSFCCCFSFCSAKSCNDILTDSTTKAENVQSVPRIASSTCSIIVLGKRIDLFVEVGIFGTFLGIRNSLICSPHCVSFLCYFYGNAETQQSMHYIFVMH